MTPHQNNSNHVYNLSNWSEGFFSIDERTGSLHAHPRKGKQEDGIDLAAVLQKAAGMGLQRPLLLRFLDMIEYRVREMSEAFQKALTQVGDTGAYRPMYPVKVNQQRDVIEAVLEGGGGLEVGTKAELLAAMSYIVHPRHGQDLCIICNGYKDRDYIRLAFLVHELGVPIYLVLEKRSEYELFKEVGQEFSAALAASFRLGLRVRLTSIARGNWQNSGGDKSKFGLSASEVPFLVNEISKQGHRLELLHTHMGSQIANIRDIKTGLKEFARYYCELSRFGVSLQAMDIGGGLAVDYIGSRTRSDFSMNYSLEHYAHAVVDTLETVFSQHSVPFPKLFNEPGRALTAHHAVLITEVVNQERHENSSPLVDYGNDGGDVPAEIQTLRRLFDQRHERPLTEMYHDIRDTIEDIRHRFIHSDMSLHWRSVAEGLWRQSIEFLVEHLDSGQRAERELLEQLRLHLADKLFCNFSLFQSIPDAWGLGQVFPVLPLQHLGAPMTRDAVIVDMTCDSDGRVDQYVVNDQVEPFLPVAEENTRCGALYGIFMVGAYQETLGDIHNLFGRPDAVNVRMDAKNGEILQHLCSGERVTDVLEVVGFTERYMRSSFAGMFRLLSEEKQKKYGQFVTTLLSKATYLE
ncbi:MAG: biosynthetic arginine decarboxylase [Gammaproteobacteria bacterium]|nr:MAG: biosynthetic arginine decarboxylase [Gammaproteobacteria bacterium]